jgi:hypothetical protein
MTPSHAQTRRTPQHIDFKRTPWLACVVAKAVQAAELEAFVVRALVLDRVLHRERMVEVIVVERVSGEVIAAG